MKKILICLVVMACLLGLSSTAFGNSGSAIIPQIYWYHAGSTLTFNPNVIVSNITNDVITVTVTIYNPDGSILSGNLFTPVQVPSLTTNLSNASVSFTLNAYSTGGFCITSGASSVSTGFGRITWSNSNGNTAQGLVAYVMTGCYINGTTSYTEIPVNNGLPF